MHEEEFILANLSLYEFMTLEQFLFDCDQKQLEQFPELTKDKLIVILTSLEKRGLIESRDQNAWKKCYPVKNKGLLHKIRTILKL
ncbi:MAG: hypothetical protein Fur0010_14270 [Bdellovibrio sp.]